MKVVYLPPGKGKTRKLVTEFLATPDSLLVVHSLAERKRIMLEYPIPNDKAPRIVDFGYVLSDRVRGLKVSTLFVDNADKMLYTTLMQFARPKNGILVSITDGSDDK